MDYFELYELTPSFFLDEEALRRKYLQYSKKYHPDFYTLESKEKQAEILELSSLNNEAYKTLRDFEQRMAYILRSNGLLVEGESKNAIPQEFLMEMMEVNEVLMELEFDFDAKKLAKIRKELEATKSQLFDQLRPQLEAFEGQQPDENILKVTQAYYLKNKYLKRLEDNLQKMELQQQK